MDNHGRPWKRDSSTKRSDYEKVQFKNCGGCLKCPSISLSFLKGYGYKNRHTFDQEENCIICKVMRIAIICEARKYLAFAGQVVQVFHVGFITLVWLNEQM